MYLTRAYTWIEELLQAASHEMNVIEMLKPVKAKEISNIKPKNNNELYFYKNTSKSEFSMTEWVLMWSKILMNSLKNGLESNDVFFSFASFEINPTIADNTCSKKRRLRL